MAVTTYYLNPGLGATTVGLTYLQALALNEVKVNITMAANSDFQAAITHQFFGVGGQTGAQYSQGWNDVSLGFPDVAFMGLDSIGANAGYFVQSIDPNWIGIAKYNISNAGESTPQMRVAVARPHTIVR